MNSLRFSRAAARVRPGLARPTIQRRAYADVASDKIQLSLTLPHQVRRWLVLRAIVVFSLW